MHRSRSSVLTRSACPFQDEEDELIPPQVGQRRKSLRPGEMVEDQKRRVNLKAKKLDLGQLLMLFNAFWEIINRQAAQECNFSFIPSVCRVSESLTAFVDYTGVLLNLILLRILIVRNRLPVASSNVAVAFARTEPQRQYTPGAKRWRQGKRRDGVIE